MRRANVWAGTLLCVGGAVSAARAQVPAEERIQITDPARLEAMGFPRDATNVYVWSKAKLDQTGGVEGGAELEAFGTSKGFTTYMGYSAFSGRNTTNHRYDNYQQGIACNAFSTGLGDHTGAVDAQIQPPNGAILDSVGWWWRNAVPPNQFLLWIYESCTPVQGRGAPIHTQIASAATDAPQALGALDGYTNVVVGRPVNTKACTYTVRVSFRNSAGPCFGDLTATYKIRDEWRRQVSPAPSTATFPADVPVGSPLHRFVEALASTGITGGCGTGAFCPDTPVTRGQMAVFLSVALGLNWGGIP